MQLGEAALRIQAAKGLADGHAGGVVGDVAGNTAVGFVTDNISGDVARTVPT